jgi:hypothetical protein
MPPSIADIRALSCQCQRGLNHNTINERKWWGEPKQEPKLWWCCRDHQG